MLLKLSCTIKTNETELSFFAEFSSDKQVDLSSPDKKSLVSGLFEVITWVSHAFAIYEMLCGGLPM
ncbi:hypothetical protein [Pseudoalteromonas sp. M8]|uniref:hypothetical protein n=1 Tax=Pseudoalteromonas sp. M8 TaxID=2692624 RepID=UPI001BAD38B7|nr:hypothetical protein [Pseudoalteromonas sp. M8]QUI72259.1 hypothetical protein GSF13_22185 [Pseudoalteromonas sp. M8]